MNARGGINTGPTGQFSCTEIDFEVEIRPIIAVGVGDGSTVRRSVSVCQSCLSMEMVSYSWQEAATRRRKVADRMTGDPDARVSFLVQVPTSLLNVRRCLELERCLRHVSS